MLDKLNCEACDGPLPERGKRIVCAFLSRQRHPKAPEEVLVGNGSGIPLGRAKRIIEQDNPVVHVFLKHGDADTGEAWEYLGKYECVRPLLSVQEKTAKRTESTSAQDNHHYIMRMRPVTELQDLVLQIKRFRDERDWAQFHTPRNLAAALSIEASELQELLLWKSDSKVRDYLSTSGGMQKVRDEIADVLIYALLFCDAVDASPEQAIADKLEKNERRYPVEKSRGSSDKYTTWTQPD